jgi:hypothetical protein
MMGWSADKVDAASPWQFREAWRGWKQANLADDKTAGRNAPSLAAHDAAFAFARTLH